MEREPAVRAAGPAGPVRACGCGEQILHGAILEGAKQSATAELAREVHLHPDRLSPPEPAPRKDSQRGMPPACTAAAARMVQIAAGAALRVACPPMSSDDTRRPSGTYPPRPSQAGESIEISLSTDSGEGGPPIEKGTRVGKYLLEEKIGHGGMAEVWRARMGGSEEFDKTFAIKFMHGDLTADPKYAKMFINEARVAQNIPEHANVVSVIEFDRVPASAAPGIAGRYYLVMEWVKGADLARLIRTFARTGRKIPRRRGVGWRAVDGSENYRAFGYPARAEKTALVLPTLGLRDIPRTVVQAPVLTMGAALASSSNVSTFVSSFHPADSRCRRERRVGGQ